MIFTLLKGIWRVDMCCVEVGQILYNNNFQDILSLLRQDSDSGSDSNLWSDSDSRFESLKKRIFDKLISESITHRWFPPVT